MTKILLALFAFTALAMIGLRLFSQDKLVELSHLNPETVQGSSRLVVVFHPFVGGREAMHGPVSIIKSVYPDADILFPGLFDGVFSNISATHTSAVLDERIQQLVDEKKQSGIPYNEIILVGYSAGALFLRKTFLYGLGESPDHPLHATGNNAKEWPGLVQRIVLLAGQNNGWSTDNLSKPLKIKAWFGEWLNALTGIGKLFVSIKKGSPFVVNLKLEWTRLANSGRKMPVVIQLLGDEDRTSPIESHFELIASPNFIFIPVSGTRHLDMVRLGAISVSADKNAQKFDFLAQKRRELFVEALTESREILEQTYGSNSGYLDGLDPDRKEVTRVVFVVHGIRDYGDWMSEISAGIRNANPEVRVISSTYGYFPLGRFLFLSDREKNVHWFTDKYAEAAALYPNSKEFHFVGHSNGTYLLASALKNYAAIKFDRVFFGGSIVRTDFPWDHYIPHRVGELKNVVAVDDWIVALFPKFFQLVRKQFGFDPDGYFGLGSAGIDGFEVDTGRNSDIFIRGGHSAATLQKAAIVEFVNTGNLPGTLESAVNGKSLLQSVSNLNWIVWIFLLIGLIFTAKVFANFRPFRHSMGRLNSYALYSVFLLGVIYTV